MPVGDGQGDFGIGSEEASQLLPSHYVAKVLFPCVIQVDVYIVSLHSYCLHGLHIVSGLFFVGCLLLVWSFPVLCGILRITAQTSTQL